MREYPLPMTLAQHKNSIDTSLPSELNWWDTESWSKQFGNDLDFADVSQEFADGISRCEVGRLAIRVCAGNWQEVRKLFLAAMIWGNSGKSADKNGPRLTKKALSDSDADRVLRSTASLLVTGKTGQAYEGFDLCAPAFSTKFFYFVGLGAKVEQLPLILDKHVARSLKTICERERWELSDFVRWSEKGGVSPYAKGYELYLHCMHQWSKALGRRSDLVEYFLYQRRGNL